jgi:hypothetical protein
MPISAAHLDARTATRDGRHDFDFLLGAWTVKHRRLRTRLAGDTTWDLFDGTCAALPILGGLGNLDDNLINLPEGAYRAVTMRAYHVEARQWSIWWLDARRSDVDPPMRGAFADDVGIFHGDDMLDGRSVRVRFVWSEITPQSARWEQAFSGDGGTTWEVNWVMDFRRAA